MRRCYLNPQVYQRFRRALNQADFESIDGPAMTSEVKTSTDVHKVPDIADLLRHQVHHDRFLRVGLGFEEPGPAVPPSEPVRASCLQK